eukprot:200069-Rhodomonas_salina.1
MLSLTPSFLHVSSIAWHQPAGQAPAEYPVVGVTVPNSHSTFPSTRSVSESPPHLLPLANVVQSNPLFSSSALLQQLVCLLSPSRQLPYQCTCFTVPRRLYPPQRLVGSSLTVPPLPYLARMQIFLACIEPRPIWLSSKEAPLKRRPAAFS